jgi:aldehyde:ferredoxin oxidoreductase
MAEFGYAGEILRIDLTTRKISTLATADYSDRFLGGRGIAAKIYWDETSPETKALSPENCLVFITGPVAGFTRFSGCRWQICGKSPEMEPEAFSYANLGGSWGSWLKYAGFDGMAVVGKADYPVYILIDNGKVEIRQAVYLWGKTTVETQNILQSELGKEAKVLSIGPAAEKQVTFATVLAAENASGSSGFGSVIGSKNLKAIVVKADKAKRPQAANPEALKSLAGSVQRLRVANFEDYGHILPGKMRLTSCYGCISGCTRWTYDAENGNHFKSFCQASGIYIGPASKYYGDGSEANLLAGRLCDKYGLDTVVMSPLITWLDECYKAGILSESETGLPLSRIGSIEFIETLVRILSLREGFGDVLARGVLRAAEVIGKGSGELLSATSLTRAGENHDYDPRLILANLLTYATEPRRAVHLHHATVIPLKRWLNWTESWKDAGLSTEVLRDIAENFWGSRESFDFSIYTGKALAAKNIKDYGYLKESLILCDLAWPIFQVRNIDHNNGFYSLESQIVSAITGRHLTEKDLNLIGERIFNLQRAILVRQGRRGRQDDILQGFLFQDPLQGTFFDPGCVVPDASGNPVSRKGAVIEKEAFEKLKDEYYTLRGWDVDSGFQTRTKLQELGLGDIGAELAKRNLVL